MEKNFTKALKYLNEAALKGHFTSLNNLGSIYKDGV
jgi:TPR repeat protein